MKSTGSGAIFAINARCTERAADAPRAAATPTRNANKRPSTATAGPANETNPSPSGLSGSRSPITKPRVVAIGRSHTRNHNHPRWLSQRRLDDGCIRLGALCSFALLNMSSPTGRSRPNSDCGRLAAMRQLLVAIGRPSRVQDLCQRRESNCQEQDEAKPNRVCGEVIVRGTKLPWGLSVH